MGLRVKIGRETRVITDQVGPFVGMAVPGEHQVYVMGIKNRNQHPSQLYQVIFSIRIVRALGIRRMVQKHDGPLGLPGGQVFDQPLVLGALAVIKLAAFIQAIAVERNEMYISCIKGVVGFVS
ncbi:hypothetical protein FQZ97_1188470 [compost metagenome]